MVRQNFVSSLHHHPNVLLSAIEWDVDATCEFCVLLLAGCR